MKQYEDRGFEFFSDSEKQFRTMLIRRLETLIAHGQLSVFGLAKATDIPKTSLYQKLDEQGSSQFTVIDLFRIAKALDISIFSLFPLDEQDRKHQHRRPLPASSLKFLDEMLAASKEDIELLRMLYQTIKRHRGDYSD